MYRRLGNAMAAPKDPISHRNGAVTHSEEGSEEGSEAWHWEGHEWLRRRRRVVVVAMLRRADDRRHTVELVARCRRRY